MNGEQIVAVDQHVDLDRFLPLEVVVLAGPGTEVAVEGEDHVLTVGVELLRGQAAVAEGEQRAQGVGRNAESLAELLARDVGHADVCPEESAFAAQGWDPLPLAGAQPLDDLAHRRTRLAAPEDASGRVQGRESAARIPSGWPTG